MMRRAVVATLLVLLSAAACAHQAEFRPFRSGSFTQLVAARPGQPFLLVLWSVTCAPCRQEFELLRDLRQAHPKMALVLVSTDDIGDRKMAAEVLSLYALEHEESWMFAEGNAAKLRYEIDPDWYGEMPRAYFYDADHGREAVSGSLDRARIESWMGK
jgi:hypothetical protein